MPCYWKCWSSSQEWLLASRATLSDQSLNINLTRPLQCLEPLEQVKKWQNSNDLILSVKNVNLRLNIRGSNFAKLVVTVGKLKAARSQMTVCSAFLRSLLNYVPDCLTALRLILTAPQLTLLCIFSLDAKWFFNRIVKKWHARISKKCTVCLFVLLFSLKNQHINQCHISHKIPYILQLRAMQ